MINRDFNVVMRSTDTKNGGEAEERRLPSLPSTFILRTQPSTQTYKDKHLFTPHKESYIGLE